MDEPDHARAYGTNPYAGYDSRAGPYPFYTGEAPPHGVPALARVVLDYVAGMTDRFAIQEHARLFDR